MSDGYYQGDHSVTGYVPPKKEQPKEDIRQRLQNYLLHVNRNPDPKTLEKTPDGKAWSLPISHVETTLDEIFFGLWDLTDCTYQQVFNEIVGTGVLTVIHPVTGQPIKRTGFASVVITQDSGAAVQDFNQTKKKNALDLTFPKMKAEILKNAAASLGKIFGRDINRKIVDEYQPLIPQDVKQLASNNVAEMAVETNHAEMFETLVDSAIEEIKKTKTESALKHLWEGMAKPIKKDQRVINAKDDKKAFLISQSKQAKETVQGVG